MSITGSHFLNVTHENGALGTSFHLDYSSLFHRGHLLSGELQWILDGVSRARWESVVLCRARIVVGASNSKKEGYEDTKSFTNYRYNESGSCFQLQGSTLRNIYL